VNHIFGDILSVKKSIPIDLLAANVFIVCEDQIRIG